MTCRAKSDLEASDIGFSFTRNFQLCPTCERSKNRRHLDTFGPIRRQGRNCSHSIQGFFVYHFLSCLRSHSINHRAAQSHLRSKCSAFRLKSRARRCLLLLSCHWKDLPENPGDFFFYPTVPSITSRPRRRTTRFCVFFQAYSVSVLFTCASCVPRGRPGRSAAGTPSPVGPSAPSCWTPPPPPSRAPPSPAAPSVAQ